MPSISWLHLTDLHFNTDPRSGMASQRWLWPNVREEFFRDLERVHRYSGPWDLVLFSGDLAQSSTEADYLALDNVLTQLWEQFKRLDCDPVLLAVPGNHDLQWPDAKSGTVRAMRSWQADRDLRDIFWADDTNEYRGLIQHVFHPYTGWWDRRSLPANVSWQRGLLPGDFSASYDKDGLTLGIVGLNSTFLQLGKGIHEGQLDLDPRQLHEVCNEDPVAWTKAHDINVLMTHHPTQWLTPEAQKHFHSEIAPGARFLLHLFGHMHEPVIQFYRRGGGGMKRELQGASLFGLESWETPEGHQVQRIHGYAAGRFEVEGKQGTLRLWPRKLIWLHSGDARMAADQAQGLDEQEAITDPFY
jgi:predicted MPP superfamily phosphohydrolase